MKSKFCVSVGIFAYNEEQNIKRLLDTIKKQKLHSVLITEILVISSGSTDKTNQIVRQLAKNNKTIKLLSQKKRLGKASAINLFIDYAKENTLIVSSADILLDEYTIEEVVKPLRKKDVGVVGSRPIPLNDPCTFLGFAAHLLWELHHRISLSTPKMGEFIAFRKIFKRIPPVSGVDEANIEALIRGQGYKAVYAPNCVVYNKGAETLSDFIRRRRHIYAGHLATKYEYNYEVSTGNGLRIFLLLLKKLEFSWRFIFWTPGVILLEVYSRLLGMYDYRFRMHSQPIWEIATSTKKLPQISKLKDSYQNKSPGMPNGF